MEGVEGPGGDSLEVESSRVEGSGVEDLEFMVWGWRFSPSAPPLAEAPPCGPAHVNGLQGCLAHKKHPHPRTLP